MGLIPLKLIPRDHAGQFEPRGWRRRRFMDIGRSRLSGRDASVDEATRPDDLPVVSSCWKEMV